MTEPKYKKPSGSDIADLKSAQEFENELGKKYKDRKFVNIGFNISIGMLVIGSYGFIERSELTFWIWCFGGVGLLFFSIFKYSNSKGEGRRLYEFDLKCRTDAINRVECEWAIKNDKYYVYLEDGRKIEVNEY